MQSVCRIVLQFRSNVWADVVGRRSTVAQTPPPFETVRARACLNGATFLCAAVAVAATAAHPVCHVHTVGSGLFARLTGWPPFVCPSVCLSTVPPPLRHSPGRALNHSASTTGMPCIPMHRRSSSTCATIRSGRAFLCKHRPPPTISSSFLFAYVATNPSAGRANRRCPRRIVASNMCDERACPDHRQIIYAHACHHLPSVGLSRGEVFVCAHAPKHLRIVEQQPIGHTTKKKRGENICVAGASAAGGGLMCTPPVRCFIYSASTDGPTAHPKPPACLTITSYHSSVSLSI